MSQILAINYPSSIDITDWILLLELRGEIRCEIYDADGNLREFSLLHSDLKQPTVQGFKKCIEEKFLSAKIQSNKTKITSVPTLTLTSILIAA